MLSRCTDAETACLENFCLQIMRAAAFKENEIFYILDCWLGLLTFFYCRKSSHPLLCGMWLAMSD